MSNHCVTFAREIENTNFVKCEKCDNKRNYSIFSCVSELSMRNMSRRNSR